MLGVGKLWGGRPLGSKFSPAEVLGPSEASGVWKSGVRGCPSSSCAARGQPEREARRGTPEAWIPRQSQARWDPWKSVAYVMDGAGWPSPFPLSQLGTKREKGRNKT